MIRSRIQIRSRSYDFAGLLVALFTAINLVPAQTADLILTNAAQIRQLAPAVAAQAIPARVTGIVTFYDHARHLAFVQDVTAGTYVDPTWHIVEPADFSGPVRAGLVVELSGHTREGRFAPFLSHTPSARILGEADQFPQPLHPMRQRLLDPTFHSQWVEVEAFVRDAGIHDGRLVLRLNFGPRSFNAYLAGDWSDAAVPTGLLKSDVRARGVYGSIFNDRRQLVDLRLFIPSLEHVQILDPGMAKAFSQPPRNIGEIMQFNPGASERIHLRGVVLAHLPDTGYYLRGQDGAIRVDTSQPVPLAPGRHVDVVGFPRAGELGPVLLDAVVKPGPQGPAPEPVAVTAETVLSAPVDGDLVRLEARLVDHLERPGNTLLLLENDRTTFHARLLEATSLPREIALGSWLELTGICVMKGAGFISEDDSVESLREAAPRPLSFSLVVRSLADIRVLHAPPWWTPRRIRSLLIGLAALTGAAFLWGALLRRKVSEQTALITAQIEREHVAEERARIARELHDTLEQQLVGITMQLDTAASRLENAPDRARRSLDLARAMLRRSQADARTSVWDLRAGELTGARLDLALREIIEPLAETAPGDIRVETGGEFPTRLDGVAKNHLLRIAQESVTNALKHAAAKHIAVTLLASRDHIELRVEDDGNGFMDNNPGGAHFGLLGMRERAGKLNADLQIHSRPGHGTTVTLRLQQPA